MGQDSDGKPVEAGFRWKTGGGRIQMENCRGQDSDGPGLVLGQRSDGIWRWQHGRLSLSYNKPGPASVITPRVAPNQPSYSTCSNTCLLAGVLTVVLPPLLPVILPALLPVILPAVLHVVLPAVLLLYYL